MTLMTMEPQHSAQSIATDVENPPQRTNQLVHEPNDLATQRPSIGSGRGSNHDVYETRAVKGLAKQLDEQDRAAKQQARRHTHHAAMPTREANSDPLPPVEVEAPLNHHHRLSLSQEKIRKTYLRTGMKPGAYPGRGNDEEDNYRVARRFDSNITDDGDDPVANKQEPSTSGDLERGEPQVVLNRDEPLVEAFVVTEDQPSVATIPPPKQDSVRPPMVQGDYVDRAKDDDHLRRNTGLYDKKGFFDGLMDRKVFCFVASLICCFLVGAVVVIIVTVTVVGQTNNNSSSNAVVPTPPGDGSSTFFPTTLSPSLENPMPPTPEVDAEETTPVPTSITPPEEEEDQTPVDTPPSTTKPQEEEEEQNNEAKPEEDTPPPTTKPQEEEEDQNNGTEPEEDTPKPTPRPTTREPTPEPTLAPETPRPTTREPTPEPTLAPTEASTEAPEESTPEPTLPPTTEVPVVVATHQPTEFPTTLAPAPTTSAPLPAPADSESYAQIIYESNYYTNGEINPSEEEQTALDNALYNLFKGLLREEGLIIQDYTIVSSLQENRRGAWHQTMTVDYYFEGDLPPMNTILNAFGKTNANAFLRDVVKKSLGPSFAVVNGIDFSFDIPIYG